MTRRTPVQLYPPVTIPAFYASFAAYRGRSPVPGQDFDPDATFDQDDYEYLCGYGRYSDQPASLNQVWIALFGEQAIPPERFLALLDLPEGTPRKHLSEAIYADLLLTATLSSKLRPISSPYGMEEIVAWLTDQVIQLLPTQETKGTLSNEDHPSTGQ